MKKEYLSHIFEPFSRADDSRTSKIYGTGLGMSIVKNIVELMSGDIQIETEEGAGSSFTVNLFLEVSSTSVNQQEEEGEQADNITEEKFSGIHVLLVEDNELNQEIAVEIFRMIGVEASVAENGLQAVEAFTQAKPRTFQMIFMDIQMPVMNGVEAAKQIRQMERADAKMIPIIAMTANVLTDDIRTTHQAGMNEHIAKPINLDRMKEIIKKWGYL